MIIEGVITTQDSDGNPHVSPLGPRVVREGEEFELRPFAGGRTFQNLLATRQGVFHIVDDALLVARCLVESFVPPMRPATAIAGCVLEAACEAFELQIADVDTSGPRASMRARVVHRHSLNPFRGWNRAKHAVLEAAILASRAQLLSAAELSAGFSRLAVLVEKTGGEDERAAFALLRNHAQASLDRPALPADSGALSDDDSVASVRVTTGARLHFGLIVPNDPALERGAESPTDEVSPARSASESARRFGGAGLMVAAPELTVTATRAEEFRVSGDLSERAAAFARRFSCHDNPPVDLHVRSQHPDHVGLGTGTQLGLAVARALSRLDGAELSIAELAERVGRGRRSAIGVHGFASGGFLVDGGRCTDGGLAPLVSHLQLPRLWRVLVIVPPGQRGTSGKCEERAFSELPAPNPETIGRLSRLLLLGLLPSLAEGDATAFGEALYEYGVRAGELFAPCQGSTFASAEVHGLVSHLRRSGVRGVGQSSWGPAVYAIATDQGHAEHIAKTLPQGIPPSAVTITSALGSGARVEELPVRPSSASL